VLVTRGLGPGGLLPTFGLGPVSVAEIVEELINNLVAASVAIDAALHGKFTIDGMPATMASLGHSVEMIEALIDAGLCDDTTSIADALRAKDGPVVKSGLVTDDGSPSIVK
jgi:hypothetical protein